MKNPKVLIVDDNPSSRMMAQYCMTQLGCDADLVEDGPTTLEKLKKNHYDLIILDWNMPNMNGRETILQADQALKYLHRHKKSHILVYSGLPMSHLNIPSSNNILVSGYLSKSFSPHKQLQVFKKYVDLVKRESLEAA